MNLRNVKYAAVFFLALIVCGFADGQTYQKGTLTHNTSTGQKSYDLKGDAPKTYQIAYCGDFQDGQVVDYRVNDNGDKVYIKREGGKDYKCSVLATSGAAAAEQPPVPTYLKGTVLGYSVRRDLHVGGGGQGAVSSGARKAKVYELRGPDMVYQMDYCGAFQAGKFSPGQVVEFRVQKERLYIRHDGDKEYSCQLEGTRMPDDAKPAPAPAAASAQPN